MGAPPSVWDRRWLDMSLAELGRFAKAAAYEAEAIRLAEPTHRAFTVGQAHRAARTLHLFKGDWTKARSLIEHWIAVLRTGGDALNLPWAVASSAWILAHLGKTSETLNRLREGEQLLERQAARRVVGDVATPIPAGWMRRAARATTSRRWPRRAAQHVPARRPLPPRPRKLYGRTGKREQAQEHLTTTTTTMYREMDMTFWLEQAGREMAAFR